MNDNAKAKVDLGPQYPLKKRISECPIRKQDYLLALNKERERGKWSTFLAFISTLHRHRPSKGACINVRSFQMLEKHLSVSIFSGSVLSEVELVLTWLDLFFLSSSSVFWNVWGWLGMGTIFLTNPIFGLSPSKCSSDFGGRLMIPWLFGRHEDDSKRRWKNPLSLSHTFDLGVESRNESSPHQDCWKGTILEITWSREIDLCGNSDRPSPQIRAQIQDISDVRSGYEGNSP